MIDSAIILSRTEMSDGYFCACVAVERAGGWEQVRLLSAPGRHLHPDLFSLPAVVFRVLWVPGFQIDVPEPDRSDPRPTHPEDRVIDPRAIRFRRLASLERFRSAIDALTYGGLETLFPGVARQGNGKAYAFGDRPQPRSVGYVPCERVTLLEGEYAAVRIAGDDLVCKVKSEPLLAQIRSGSIAVGQVVSASRVRLGLANPSDWDGRFDPPRCYVMLTGTVL